MDKNMNICDNCPLRKTYTEHNSEKTVALAYVTNGNHEGLSIKGRTIYNEVGAGISLDSRIGNLLLNNAGNCNGPVLKGRRERRRIRRESIEGGGVKVSPDSQCPSLNQIPIEILKAEVNAVASRLEGW